MSAVTTHVLDAGLGRPGAGVPVRLERADGRVLAANVTDADGRIAELGPSHLEPGAYRLVFDIETYSAATGQTHFFPEIALTFTVSDGAHYHVPLLLSPFAYSTYRGS
ncbi:hydroxyisourate hydrolase [Nocardia panacis]|uniref:5-hydroxyisourate hydrolase n=1 Tax=Nocardia panacis TaxID=2340916 RepID=A0A3A4KND0_9NOCA|nr:hydroxyisourate hydrolase [Nocardia panacis]RJO75636.1 hydroxyisourate hydrolase [Nocardia panacis]